MPDDAILSMSLLTFRLKNFDFAHRAESGGRPYLVFRRTETESESKLRPRLVRMWVAVPEEWVIYDEAADELLLGRDGITPGPASTGIALESAADPERFDDRGLPWRRHRLRNSNVLYVPAERAEALLATDGLAALALDD